MTMSYQIEMHWDCPACGNQEIPGRDPICGVCGRPKTESEEFTMPADTSPERAVTDQKLLTLARSGPDWSCPYCDSSQRNSDGDCIVCGAERKSSRPEPKPKLEPVSYPQADSHLDLTSYPKPKTPWLAISVLTLIIVGVLFLGVWLIQPVEADVVVSSLAWERTISVERLEPVVHEDWSVPTGATDVKNLGDRIHHHDRVLDHYESESYLETVPCGETCTTIPGKCTTTPRVCKPNGNGFATCTEGKTSCKPPTRSCTPKTCKESRTRERPVYRLEARYRTWYGYTTMEWVFNRQQKSEGHDSNPTWPGTELDSNERQSTIESYSVFLQEVGGTGHWTYQTTQESQFKSKPVGSKHRIRVSWGRVEFMH